jgi:hypothetical protein
MQLPSFTYLVRHQESEVLKRVKEPRLEPDQKVL